MWTPFTSSFQQAGHSALTADRLYATGKHTLLGTSASEFDKFRKASLALPNLLELAFPGCLQERVSLTTSLSDGKAVSRDLLPTSQKPGVGQTNIEKRSWKSEEPNSNNQETKRRKKLDSAPYETRVLKENKYEKGSQAALDWSGLNFEVLNAKNSTRKTDRSALRLPYTFVMQDLQRILPSLQAMMKTPDAMFRSEVQLEAVQLSLDRREDIIVVMPTGSGKSLLY